MNQLHTALQHLELRLKELETGSGVGLQLGGAPEKLLPGRRHDLTERVAV